MSQLMIARLRETTKGRVERDSAIILLLALIVGSFFWPSFVVPDSVIWSQPGLGSDISGLHWHQLTRFGGQLRAGQLALWAPQMALGRPLAGDTDAAFIYPFNVIFAFLPPALAFNLFDATHVFLAAMFTFLLLRVGGNTSRPAALLGGLSFAFAPKMMAHLAVGHIGTVAGLAWVPAALLAFKLALDGSLLAAALAGLALALQLPAHVYIPLYTLFIVSVFWLWRFMLVFWQREKRREIARLAVIYGVMIASFALLAAAVLAPLIELMPYNSRANYALADANAYALPPTLLFTLLAPPRTHLHEWTIFLGVLTPLLAIVGWRESPRRIKWQLVLLTAFALVYSLGTSTPLFGLILAVVPGFRLLRVPTRIWFFGGLAVSLLAGLGLETLGRDGLRQKWMPHRLWLPGSAGVYLVGSLAAFVAYRMLFQQWHWQLVVQLAVIIVTTVAGWVWLKGYVSGRALQWLLIPVLLLDLLPLAADHLRLVNPRAEFLASTPAFDFVSAQPGVFRVYSPPGDIPFSLAAERNVDLLEGQIGFQISHSVTAIRLAVGCSRPGHSTSIPVCLDDIVPTSTLDAYRLGLLNVRYIITPHPLSDPDLKAVFYDEQDWVYENLLWQPRARLKSEGAVEIVRRDAGEYELKVSALEPGQLVVSETWLPGWQATVDGRSVTLQQVEGALIGVAVESGQHHIRLSYNPLGWRIGWPVSLASLAGLILWVIVEVVKRRRHGG